MDSSAGASVPRGVVALVGALAAIYLVSQFLRNSVGVIAPDLAAEIGLSAGEIGLLSSAFFFAFAAAQLPLGIALDRYGPKRCMLVCAAIAVLGTLQFAIATTPAGLIAARVLMGLGSSCYLMAPLALYARRFPPERFTVLAGIQLAIGTIGTLFVTAPLAWASATIGWRTTFLAVAGLMAVCAVLVAIVVREDGSERSHPAASETLRESLAGVLEVVDARVRAAVPDESHVVLELRADRRAVGRAVSRPRLRLRTDHARQPADAAGDQPHRRCDGVGTCRANLRRLQAAGARRCVVDRGRACAAGRNRSAGAVLARRLADVVRFMPAYIPVLIAHGRSFLPPNLVGRGMTMFNIGTIGGAFVVQLVSGALIDLFPAQGGVYPLEAYRLVFGVQALGIRLPARPI